MDFKKIIFSILVLFINPLMGEEIYFDVYMDDERVGTHYYEISDTKIVSKANYKIQFLFMNFTYKHESFETYDSGCLSLINSMTDDDGDKFLVSGKKNNGTLQISMNNKPYDYDGCITTFIYWDSDIVNKTKLLNAQNAELLDIKTTYLGEKDIKVNNSNVKTKHYELVASLKGHEKFIINLWYDDNKKWVQLLSPTAAGDLIYKIRSTPVEGATISN